MSRSGATRFIAFVLVGIVLGYVLNLLAGLGGQRAVIWIALTARLALFVIVVAVLARSHGPAAGLVVLLATVITRWLLVRRRFAATR